VLIVLLAEGHVTVGASVGMRESRTLAECPSFGCLALLIIVQKGVLTQGLVVGGFDLSSTVVLLMWTS
jgi:hypothetical protein